MCIAVINLGLKSVRCIVFDSDGKKVSSSSVPVTTFVWDAYVEQDAAEWWQKAQKVMTEAFGALPSGIELKGLTVTTSASCLVSIDKELNPLRRVIMVSDRRSVSQCAHIGNAESFAAVKAKVGIGATTDTYLPKILWIKENEPEVYEKTWKFISPADYLFLKLGVSEAITDVNNAMKYHYIAADNAYPLALLDDLGLNVDTLPAVSEPFVVIGRMNDALKQQIGVSGKAALVLSSYDAICSVLGSGVVKAGQVCDVSGTVTSVRGLSRHHLNDSLGRVFTIPWLEKDEGLWLVGGSNNMGGGLIEWSKQLFLSDMGEQAYEIMVSEAQEVPPCSRGLLFLPYILGERAPLWNPDARGVFFGLERKHTRKDIFRAIFESAAFATKHLLGAIKGLGINTTELYSSGGLARLDVISQIKADVTGIPVKIPEDFESTSFGAAIMAMKGLGMCGSLAEGAEKMVKVDKVFEPDQTRHVLYSEWYDLYLSLYQNLRGLYAERERITNSNLFRSISPETVERKENL
jgi:xylulokinase